MEYQDKSMHKQTGTPTVRRLKEEEIPIIESWYKARKDWKMFKKIPRDIYPFDGQSPSAYVLEADNQLHYCCWLYISNSNMAVIDWFVSNPKTKGHSISFLIDQVTKLAKNKFYCRYCISLFDNNKILHKTFTDLGFMKGSDCTNYLKKI